MKATENILSGQDYIESLRGRNLDVYLFGERVEEPVDHPMIRPSVNAVAATYDLAMADPELATAMSPYTGERINRFLHIASSRERGSLSSELSPQAIPRSFLPRARA